MAVFGSPVSRGIELEAQQALRCAQAMRLALQQHIQQWALKGLPPLNCGIGLANGDAVVGQIGSPQRMDFTVIGDTVNRARRLESLTRQLSTPILVDERTALLVQSEQPMVDLGAQAIKGMDQIQIYRPTVSPSASD